MVGGIPRCTDHDVGGAANYGPQRPGRTASVAAYGHRPVVFRLAPSRRTRRTRRRSASAMSALDPASIGLARYGTDLTIYEWVRITGADRISVGDHVLVDDFVFLQGGQALEIGSYVHIASYASITGGGVGVVAPFVGIAAGARVFTGSDLGDGSGLIGPRIPNELRAVRRHRTELGAHVFIGANAVVLPGVTVGEGAVIGAGSVVTGSIEPWTINVGVPARPVKRRPSETILRYAKQLGY
jgi:acetyltransferase-like isoleucine patch superfamily enzyme